MTTDDSDDLDLQPPATEANREPPLMPRPTDPEPSDGSPRVDPLAAIFAFGVASLAAVLAVSGIGLMFHYIPSPDYAYDSIRSLESEQPHGTELRSLHHYGTSAIVGLLLITLIWTFWRGAYRRPYRVRWLCGLGAFGVLVGFGITGDLLPWSEQAFYATDVRTNIFAAAPGGPELRRLMLGGEQLASPTLTRFYVLHVVVLPIALLALGLIFVMSGRRAGSGRKRYWLTWGRVLFAIAATAGLFWFAQRHAAPLGGIVEPGDAEFEARPEWYFLWLNQLLALVPGDWASVPAFWLPLALGVMAAALPFIDRGRVGIVLRVGSIVLAIGIGILTWQHLDARKTNRAPLPYALGLTPDERTGHLLVRRHRCIDCHALGDYGKTDFDAPDLDDLDGDLSLDEFADLLADPEDVLGTDDMPAFDYVPREQLRKIGLYLKTLNR